ncbi:MAG: type I-B CRISPR-associated protein Cas7/Csh2 [Chloroflexi bacterium]|nr:type I-B CRISPR-associated protein Cas7/Csh2 [Chloroflexota bacterium]
MTVERNSEILFLYDARLCNPNGDPDEENRPRMDYETRRNLVSDVRLKRYLRDYWIAWKPEAWTQKPWEYPVPQDVWVRTMGGATVSAKQRIDGLAEAYAREKGLKKASTKNLAKDPEFRQWLLERLIDVRMFGATMPIGAESEGGAGGHITYTGPVQYSWGYSLNRVDLVPSSTITSHFAGRERGEKGEYGTMGKDWRVKYSFLAFYGLVSAWRAQETGLQEKDIKLLGHSLINGLPLMATSRSKIGQTPRLYLRVEYADDATFLGDFRTRLHLSQEEGLESIADVDLDFTDLVTWLAEHKDAIRNVVVWAHDEFASGQALVPALKDALGADRVQDLNDLMKRIQASS